jgi:ABC-type transporter Mla maintaining outer membrane lipid asymmetry ATPase subunit MlaF
LADELRLSIITPQGWSLLTLVGTLEGAEGAEAVPVALAGAVTRQLAPFGLAAALMEGAPVVLLDEPELGLEPCRQRRLVQEIRAAIGDHGASRHEQTRWGHDPTLDLSRPRPDTVPWR